MTVLYETSSGATCLGAASSSPSASPSWEEAAAAAADVVVASAVASKLASVSTASFQSVPAAASAAFHA